MHAIIPVVDRLRKLQNVESVIKYCNTESLDILFRQRNRTLEDQRWVEENVEILCDISAETNIIKYILSAWDT